MQCCTYKNRVSAYLDGGLPEGESIEVRLHADACGTCSAEMADILRLRNALRSLPKQTPSDDLTMRLRVMASREHARAQHPSPVVYEYWQKLRLFSENLMRPIALPIVGGVCSAIFLFSSLVPSFTFRDTRGMAGDVPIMLSTEPLVKNMAPLGFMVDGVDAVVDLRIDEAGRIVNYAIVDAQGKRADELRRSIENNLLFTTFTPATAFGKPIASTIRLSFRSSRIEVRG